MEDGLLMEKYRFGGEVIDLITIPGKTFPPNQTTETVYGSVEVNDGDVGIEIGAGIGVGSIILGRRPLKHLYTVEILQLQCDLQARNLKAHGLDQKVSVLQGSLFDPIRYEFPDLKVDFVVSDVSGMNDIGVELGWYPENVPRGGEDGTENIIPFLRDAKHFLYQRNSNARIYFPIVVNFSDGKKIINIARENYSSLEKIADRNIPLKQEQLVIIDKSKHKVYEPIERKGSRGFWKVEVYRAMNPIY
ncbi:hypothetical protein HYW75_00695 [Candidatus Pacearchaeota archaeon]|nr:hypothetical protein [Candidatus Pacearchaeota archaeon]